MSVEKELRETLEYQKSLELSEKHLGRLEEHLKKSYQHLKVLERILQKEYQDIVALEKMSIRKLFGKVLGNNEEQMEIERQEYLEAILNHKDYLKSVELMEFEQKILLEKVKEIPATEKKIKRLAELREAEVLNHGGKSKPLLRTLNGQIDEAFRLKREIYEAKIVGTKLKVKLQLMIENLTEAAELEDWNSQKFSMGAGRGYVNRAQEIFYEIKHLIRKFEDELSDIYLSQDIKILKGLENLDRVTNIYYDNLISDWIVKKRIHNSLHNIVSLSDRIIRTLNSLDHEERQADEKIKYLTERKRTVVLDELKG